MPQQVGNFEVDTYRTVVLVRKAANSMLIKTHKKTRFFQKLKKQKSWPPSHNYHHRHRVVLYKILPLIYLKTYKYHSLFSLILKKFN